MPKSPYETSDKAIELLNKKAIKRFKSAQRQAWLLGFDELNIIKIVTELYQELAKDNRTTFLDLAFLVYNETTPHGTTPPDSTWLLALLDEYDPVTLYQYSKEVPRKRDRAIESIIAATDKGKEFQKALRYWSAMTQEYADIVTYQTIIKAFKDAGVKKVRWITEDDDRVCEICGPRHMKIYSIDDVPPKAHWGCRCWIEPA